MEEFRSSRRNGDNNRASDWKRFTGAVVHRDNAGSIVRNPEWTTRGTKRDTPRINEVRITVVRLPYQIRDQVALQINRAIWLSEQYGSCHGEAESDHTPSEFQLHVKPSLSESKEGVSARAWKTTNYRLRRKSCPDSVTIPAHQILDKPYLVRVDLAVPRGAFTVANEPSNKLLIASTLSQSSMP